MNSPPVRKGTRQKLFQTFFAQAQNHQSPERETDFQDRVRYDYPPPPPPGHRRTESESNNNRLDIQGMGP